MKYKKRTPGHKKLLNLFNDLSGIILADKTLGSECEENENEKLENRKKANEDKDYEIENQDKYYDYKNEYEYEYENEDDETMSQKIIKNLNDNLDEIIDKSKSFEDQIESLKKLEDLKEYLPDNNYDDKQLKFKIFKLKLADTSNEIDEKSFEQIFRHTLIKLADKLMNATKKKIK